MNTALRWLQYGTNVAVFDGLNEDAEDDATLFVLWLLFCLSLQDRIIVPTPCSLHSIILRIDNHRFCDIILIFVTVDICQHNVAISTFSFILLLFDTDYKIV